DYLTELQRHAEELKRNPSEWMPWNYRETLRRLATHTAAKYDESCMAEKDRLPPGGGVTRKWPENGPFRNQSLTTFLARHGADRKCSGSGCMPESRQMINRPWRCRIGRCGTMQPGGAGPSPCRSA